MSDLYHIDPERHKRAAKTLHLVQQCEDKYGSISRTPLAYPPFAKVRDMWSENKNNVNLPTDIQDKIAEKVDEGFSVAYIRQKYHVGSGTVKKIIDGYHVRQKPLFYYILESQNNQKGPKFYFRSLRKGMKLLLHHELTNPQVRANYLKRLGLILKRRNTIWKNIKIGDFYVGDNSNFFHKKVSEKDYEDEIIRIPNRAKKSDAG